MAVSSLVLGIFSVILAIIDLSPLVMRLINTNYALLLFLAFVPVVAGLAALVLGSLTNRKDSDGRASLAKLLAVVTLVLSLIIFDNIIYTERDYVPQSNSGDTAESYDDYGYDEDDAYSQLYESAEDDAYSQLYESAEDDAYSQLYESAEDDAYSQLYESADDDAYSKLYESAGDE